MLPERDRDQDVLLGYPEYTIERGSLGSLVEVLQNVRT
jgi:hypothetical protein